MTKNSAKDDDDRVHNEAPAEGDPNADSSGLRVHPQDPAEGADPADPANGTDGDGGASK